LNRWSIPELVEAQVLGFEREKRLKHFLPFEEVQSVTKNIIDDNGRIVLKSKSYEATFREEYFEPARRTFRGATMLLANKPKNALDPKKEHLGHLLFFDLGQSYYAILAPIAPASLKEVRS